MAYEKLYNEIYAALSLKYLWPEYRTGFTKSESPDWINETMNLGMEVSQALLPEDGQTEDFIEAYLGCRKEELPDSAFEHYGNRLYFYNDRFWAVLPQPGESPNYHDKAMHRFECKLKKLNTNYQHRLQNALYLFLHPAKEEDTKAAAFTGHIQNLYQEMKKRQSKEQVPFDWVFLDCRDVIFICCFSEDTVTPLYLPKNAELFLKTEAERLRYCSNWEDGAILDEYC
ncbi:MAG: hypothetical protein PUB22_02835 [Clostridiales bacterium]|nr:hypothetical protein [Clostridiales bacterium]